MTLPRVIVSAVSEGVNAERQIESPPPPSPPPGRGYQSARCTRYHTKSTISGVRRAVGLLAACLLLMAGSALADDEDASALQLADTAPAAVEKARDWRAFVEGGYGGSSRRDGDPARYSRRLSFDIQYDHSFSSEWRAVFADRLDINSPKQGTGENSINTIKEAYLSWRAQADTILDLGRVNVRNGVAMGYNPTDYFRTGVLRSVVSISPASLKENRQGSAMLRAQQLWDSGSVTALYSPKLVTQASSNAFNPDWGASNNRDRWLIALNQKVDDNFNPQLLLYQEEHQRAQIGLNLTALLNDATVAYLEWSGGRSPSLLAQSMAQAALPHADDSAFHNRLSTGATYTTPNKISLTAEYEYNGGGIDQSDWDALRRGPLPLYGLYRGWVQAVQDQPTRQTLFFYGMWQDALITHLDLSAMESVDVADASHRSWLEARYHLDQFEYALQWQRNSGKRFSDFGAAPQRQSWLASLRYYF